MLNSKNPITPHHTQTTQKQSDPRCQKRRSDYLKFYYSYLSDNAGALKLTVNLLKLLSHVKCPIELLHRNTPFLN